MEISIHEVFADLDGIPTSNNRSDGDFNPRGLRRPRPDVRAGVVAIEVISIHEVFADLDRPAASAPAMLSLFQSTRSSQTSTRTRRFPGSPPIISIHEVFADLDKPHYMYRSKSHYFNPRGLRRPRLYRASTISTPQYFNPRGLRRPRLIQHGVRGRTNRFQSTRSSQTSTVSPTDSVRAIKISIHEVFADLDVVDLLVKLSAHVISIHEVFADLDPGSRKCPSASSDFNPRGLRRPRRIICLPNRQILKFQSTRSSQTSTFTLVVSGSYSLFQSTRSSQTSTPAVIPNGGAVCISIHEVFADLDLLQSQRCK